MLLTNCVSLSQNIVTKHTSPRLIMPMSALFYITIQWLDSFGTTNSLVAGYCVFAACAIGSLPAWRGTRPSATAEKPGLGDLPVTRLLL